MSKFKFENNSIHILDVAKQQKFKIIFLLSMNILNPILFINISDHVFTYWLNILWIIIGIASIISLWYLLFMKKYQSEIKRESIQSISSKSTSLAKSINFKLLNGKKRTVNFSNTKLLLEQLNSLQQNGYETT